MTRNWIQEIGKKFGSLTVLEILLQTKSGNETRARNCKSALTKRMVMGTNLTMISRSDDQPMAHNTSGYTGVSYDRNRNKYESYLIFQGDKYCSRHNSFAEAVASRKAMKQIHKDFIDEYYSKEK